MLNRAQLSELDRLVRTHPKGGMRVKFIAVRAVAMGSTRQQVGAMLNVSPYSVGQWFNAYLSGGLEALEIRKGRGRPSRIDVDQLEEYVRQSPRNFGIGRTRWTLRLLAEHVPCLQGLKPNAVWYALERAGISYKRAEPWLHSPDPEYGKKNATSKTSSPRRGRTRKK